MTGAQRYLHDISAHWTSYDTIPAYVRSLWEAERKKDLQVAVLQRGLKIKPIVVEKGLVAIGSCVNNNSAKIINLRNVLYRYIDLQRLE